MAKKSTKVTLSNRGKISFGKKKKAKQQNTLTNVLVKKQSTEVKAVK